MTTQVIPHVHATERIPVIRWKSYNQCQVSPVQPSICVSISYCFKPQPPPIHATQNVLDVDYNLHHTSRISTCKWIQLCIERYKNAFCSYLRYLRKSVIYATVSATTPCSLFLKTCTVGNHFSAVVYPNKPWFMACRHVGGWASWSASCIWVLPLFFILCTQLANSLVHLRSAESSPIFSMFICFGSRLPTDYRRPRLGFQITRSKCKDTTSCATLGNNVIWSVSPLVSISQSDFLWLKIIQYIAADRLRLFFWKQPR